MIKKRIASWVLVLGLASNNVFAEEVLVRGKEAKVSKEQFETALQRMDDKTRFQFLNKEKRVLKAVKNFYITEVAVARAKKTGIYESPKMQAIINKAVADTVLKEMYQQYLDKAMAGKKFEGLARDQYKANREKYKKAPEVSASHILIDYKKRCKEDVQALAEKIRKQLLNGKDFITLAKKYSDDPSVKKNNGSLGYFSKKRMVKKFSDAAFALKKVGDISPVIETKYGLHIIRLDEEERTETIPFEKVKDVLVKDLRHKIVGNINQNFKSDLLDAENIDINLDAIKGLVTH